MKTFRLREDQADVIADCLEHALKEMAGVTHVPSAAYLDMKIARKRVREVLEIFRPSQPLISQPDAPAPAALP